MLIVYDPLDEILAAARSAQPARLQYYASDLQEQLGTDDDPAVRGELVRRIMKICHAAGIPIDRNFRLVYRYSGSALEPDWRLSALAAVLFLLNADPDNPLVAKAQLMMILKTRDAR